MSVIIYIISPEDTHQRHYQPVAIYQKGVQDTVQGPNNNEGTTHMTDSLFII